jgi:hypothetical protein
VAPPPPPVAAPVLPPEARERTAQGAEAFTRYWFDVLAYSYATGDTAPLVESSAEDCQSCSTYVDEIESRYASGGSFAGVRVDVLGAVAGDAQDWGTLVSAEIFEHGSLALSPTGDIENQSLDYGPSALLFAAEWDSERWVAFGMADEE